MKKFKLIKEYPKSQLIGTVVEIRNYNPDCLLQHCVYNPGKSNESMEYTTYEFFAKHSEFWEELKSNEWEILSIRDITHRSILDVIDNKVTSPAMYGSISIDDVLKNWIITHKTWEIYSVKRLSDGEIFIIGQKGKQGTISRFRVTGDMLVVLTDKYSLNGIFLHQLTTTDKPLFTTEDSIDIYENNRTLIHQVHVGYGYETTRVDSYDDPKSYYINNKNWKFFSTKEAAKEYIIMNKPCLSINDILNITIDHRIINVLEDPLEEIKKLVKSKL